MLKKFYTCDCFLDVSSCCLEIDAVFDCFRKKCLRQKKYKDTFIIHDCTDTERSNFSPVKFALFVVRRLRTFK